METNPLRPRGLHLRHLGLLGRLSDDHLETLAQVAAPVHLEPGQRLFEEGARDHDLYVVCGGRLEATRATAVGAQPLARFSPGDLVGEVAFCDGLPHAGAAIAADAADLIRFPAPAIQEVLAHDPRFAVALFQVLTHALAAKLRQATAHMGEIIPGFDGGPAPVAAAPGTRVTLGPAAKLAVLRQLGLLAAETDLLAATMRAESYPPGAVIAAEGEVGDILFVVGDGKVRISRRLAGGGEEALAILGRGEAFGEPGMLGAQPLSSDARAHDAGCTVLSIHRRRLEAALNEWPEVGREFLAQYCRVLCGRLRALVDALAAWRTMAAHW